MKGKDTLEMFKHRSMTTAMFANGILSSRFYSFPLNKADCSTTNLKSIFFCHGKTSCDIIYRYFLSDNESFCYQ